MKPIFEKLNNTLIEKGKSDPNIFFWSCWNQFAIKYNQSHVLKYPNFTEFRTAILEKMLK